MPDGNGELKRLTEQDWEMLLPGKEFKLGNTSIIIRPLGLEDLALALIKIQAAAEYWRAPFDEAAQEEPDSKKKKGQKKSPAQTKEQELLNSILKYLPKVSKTIMVHAPDLIQDMSGVALEDIKRVPLKIAVDLLTFCLTINIEAQRGLEKNFGDLVDGIAILTGEVETITQASERLPST